LQLLPVLQRDALQYVQTYGRQKEEKRKKGKNPQTSVSFLLRTGKHSKKLAVKSGLP